MLSLNTERCRASRGLVVKSSSYSASPPVNRRKGPYAAENHPAPLPQMCREGSSLDSGSPSKMAPMGSICPKSPGTSSAAPNLRGRVRGTLPSILSSFGSCTSTKCTWPCCLPRCHRAHSRGRALASSGPTRANARDRSTVDFPEPLSPRMTCQPAARSAGTSHSSCWMARMFWMTNRVRYMDRSGTVAVSGCRANNPGAQGPPAGAGIWSLSPRNSRSSPATCSGASSGAKCPTPGR